MCDAGLLALTWPGSCDTGGMLIDSTYAARDAAPALADAGRSMDAVADGMPREFAGSVRQAIDTLSCGESYPSLPETAALLRLSVRTLQRRLAAAGVSHDVLVAEARFATAVAVLEATDGKILELALDLGYSDHANFTRAFRRWAGCSPRQYRARHRGPFEASSSPESVANVMPPTRRARTWSRSSASCSLRSTAP